MFQFRVNTYRTLVLKTCMSQCQFNDSPPTAVSGASSNIVCTKHSTLLTSVKRGKPDLGKGSVISCWLWQMAPCLFRMTICHRTVFAFKASGSTKAMKLPTRVLGTQAQILSPVRKVLHRIKPSPSSPFLFSSEGLGIGRL